MQIIEINGRKFKLPSESERALCKSKMEKMRKEGEKMIKGIFEFIDAQGGWIDFSYRFYPGEPIRTVKIAHGETINIPMDLAKHLNNVTKKVRVMRENADQGQDKVVKMSRTRFIPLDIT